MSNGALDLGNRHVEYAVNHGDLPVNLPFIQSVIAQRLVPIADDFDHGTYFGEHDGRARTKTDTRVDSAYVLIHIHPFTEIQNTDVPGAVVCLDDYVIQ